jgi:hypothetical protein
VLDFVLAVTLVSFAIISSFTLKEFLDHLRVDIEISVVVDRSRGALKVDHSSQCDVHNSSVLQYCESPTCRPGGFPTASVVLTTSLASYYLST